MKYRRKGTKRKLLYELAMSKKDERAEKERKHTRREGGTSKSNGSIK